MPSQEAPYFNLFIYFFILSFEREFECEKKREDFGWRPADQVSVNVVGRVYDFLSS